VSVSDKWYRNGVKMMSEQQLTELIYKAFTLYEAFSQVLKETSNLSRTRMFYLIEQAFIASDLIRIIKISYGYELK